MTPEELSLQIFCMKTLQMMMMMMMLSCRVNIKVIVTCQLEAKLQCN